MKMKRFCLAMMLLTLSASAAWADQVAVGDFIYYGLHTPTFLNGGPFDIYAAKADGAGKGGYLFTTFCVEGSEYLSNPIYVYGISDTAYYGSEGPQGDRIDWQTALIYYSWRTGSLPSPESLGYTGPLRQAQLVQQAIWYLEGEPNGADNIYVSWANSQPQWNNLYVRVLNTYQARDAGNYYEILYKDGQPVRSQDQLVLIPEPATLLLVGTGLVCAFALSKRRRN